MHRIASHRRFWAIALGALVLGVLAFGVNHAVADNSDNGTDVVHFKSDGGGAYFYQYKAGSHYYYVYATETKSTSSTGTDTRYVYAQVTWYDYTTTPVSSRVWRGNIPADAFDVSSASASLTLDTADMTNKYTYKYPATLPALDIEIDLTWTPNGTYSYSTNGHSQYKQSFGGYEYRYVTNGKTDYDYTDVEGTWNGDDVVMEGTTQAYMTSNNNVSHTMSKFDD